MASAVKRERTEREESCFSRAVRSIRRALSRICRDNSPPPRPGSCPRGAFSASLRPPSASCLHRGPRFASRQPPPAPLSAPTYSMISYSDSEYEGSLPVCRYSAQDSFTFQPPKRKPSLKKRKKDSSEPRATAGRPTLHFCTSDDDDDDDDSDSPALCRARFHSPPSSDPYLHPPHREDADDGGPRFNVGCADSLPACSQSVAVPVAGPPRPRDRLTAARDSTVTEGSRAQGAFESESLCESDALMEMEAPVAAVSYSVNNTLPAHSHLLHPPGCFRSSLPRAASMPSLVTSAKNETLRRAESLPDMLLKTSSEEFTPEITADESDETYRFQCSGPGLYQCSVTGLVFGMLGEGDVLYRIVPWNRRLLAQHHKRPAGPLFDIKCLQQSVCQLHLPHCEIRSTGGCDFLSVAHVDDEGVEFISPDKTTETHVVLNVTGFSAFGNVKDEDAPAVPVRALVLLFYRPPADPDLTSLLNVLLLPRNVALRDVLRTRKKLVGDENYIETSPHCKLHPQQEYTLSTCPEDDSVLVQPTEAEFDCDNYDDYFPTFQVSLENIMKHIKLFLRDTNSSHSVWERRVCLSSSGVRRSCGQSALSLPPKDRLLDIRSSFIDGISGPVLKNLLDKLLEKKVMADAERESADVLQNKRDTARFVIDTVRKKGDAASSEMIDFLCEADPFLCEHLGLM